MPWTLWLIFAAFLVLPVLLRSLEEEEPDNAIVHDSGGDQDGRLPGIAPRDEEPDGLLAAALGFRP